MTMRAQRVAICARAFGEEAGDLRIWLHAVHAHQVRSITFRAWRLTVRERSDTVRAWSFLHDRARTVSDRSRTVRHCSRMVIFRGWGVTYIGPDEIHHRFCLCGAIEFLRDRNGVCWRAGLQRSDLSQRPDEHRAEAGGLLDGRRA